MGFIYDLDGVKSGEDNEAIIDLTGECVVDNDDNDEFNPLDSAEEPQWVPFLSVDPGPVNCGVVMGKYRMLLEKGVVEVQLYKDRLGTMTVTDAKTRNIHDLNRDWISAVYTKFPDAKQFLKGGVTIIEEQYVSDPRMINHKNTFWITLQLQLLSATIYNVMKEHFGTFVDFVNSLSYKTALHIKTGKHDENKRTALAFCRELLQGVPITVKTDHEADAIDQFFFWVQESANQILEKDSGDSNKKVKVVWLVASE